jgi:hypothetical protein
LRLSGHTIVASDLVGTTEQPTLHAFLDGLRRGDRTAASKLAAPGVTVEAANQFRSYPSALAATPTCYGFTDMLSRMPQPLVTLMKDNLGTDRLCALSTANSSARWITLGMRHTGFRAWQIFWVSTA